MAEPFELRYAGALRPPRIRRAFSGNSAAGARRISAVLYLASLRAARLPGAPASPGAGTYTRGVNHLHGESLSRG